jgi:ubiquitin-conjugating enzyme E2 M
MIKTIYKEIKSINTNSIWEDQAQIDFVEGPENPFVLLIILKPKYGYFKGTTIQFKLNLQENLETAPVVTCLDKIFHPNIDFTGRVCFSMFSDAWSKEYNIEHYVNGLVCF